MRESDLSPRMRAAVARAERKRLEPDGIRIAPDGIPYQPSMLDLAPARATKRPRELGMRESALQAAVLELARRLGWLCYHTWNSKRSAPGFPDWVMVRECRLIFAELKREREQPTVAQVEWLERLRHVSKSRRVRAIEVYVWRPSDWMGGTIERILR